MAGRSIFPDTGPIVEIGLAVADAVLPPRILRIFRRDPEVAGCWLFKEEWPFGGVWRIHGSTSLKGDEIIFVMSRRDALEGEGIGLILWVVMVIGRRRWLHRNAQRVPRRLWKRAIPLV